MSLSVIKPIVVTPEMLVDTNVPEEDYPEWGPGDSFDTGGRVIVEAEHNVYQSLVDGNIGNVPVNSPTKWQLVGSTNRWKPFDQKITSQVEQPSLITYQLKPGQTITSLAILNLRAATKLTVRMVDPDYGEVKLKVVNLSRIPVSSGWWAWFFGERRAPTQAIINGLPTYPNADLFIDIEGGDTLAVGVILIGRLRTFSMGVKRGVRLGINDFSRKERNPFGDTFLLERPFSRRINFSMMLKKRGVDSLDRFLTDVRAVLCLWVVSSRFESSIAYGFYKSFEILLNYYDYADCDIDIEGIT